MCYSILYPFARTFILIKTLSVLCIQLQYSILTHTHTHTHTHTIRNIILSYLISITHNTGIAALGEKLNLDVESDLRILVLLWKIQEASSSSSSSSSNKPGVLLKSDWMEAARQDIIHVSKKWESLQAQVPAAWDVGFLTNAEFKDFYKFCFQFNRQGTHRTLDRDLVIALLKLVLKDRVAADRLESFCEFLETLDHGKNTNNTNAGAGADNANNNHHHQQHQQQYNRITLDQWTSFWDFCIECEDLQSYDESTSAWPVLIDEYVEFMEEKLKEK